MTPRFGYLPDPIDPRDYGAGEILASAIPPERASLRPYVIDVLDQGGLNSCVANAVAQAVRIAHVRALRQTGDYVTKPSVLSRLAVYYLARATHGWEKRDEGTYIRAALQMMREFGFCPELEWPYVEANVNVRPSFGAFHGALDQSEDGRGEQPEYRRIDTTGASRILDIKRAISQGYAVVFGTDVSMDFASNRIDPTKPLDPPVGQPIAGGHAMIIDSYDRDSFGIVNSYSHRWGDNGVCVFSADYLASYMTRDLQIVSRAPQYSVAK